MSKKLEIHFGAIADPIATQLENQGFKFAKEKVQIFQKELDSITRLRFGSHILTDSMADKCYGKLMKAITKHVNLNNYE